MTHEMLMEIAHHRLKEFNVVFANRGEERGPNGEQVGWLCRRKQAPLRLIGKSSIAKEISNCLDQEVERTLSKLAQDAESS